MKIVVDQRLPIDLGIFRKFLDKATKLVDGDMTSNVIAESGSIRIISVAEIEGEY